MGYDQSRNDQDVADAASLAASYWLSNNEGTATQLTGAFTAAQNVANKDCTGPDGGCTTVLAFYSAAGYAATPPTALCSGTLASNNCSTTSNPSGQIVYTDNVTYVGMGVSNTSTEVLANLNAKGSRTYTVAASAVAAIPGGSGGSNGTSTGCELCVLQSGGINVSGTNVNIIAWNGAISTTGTIDVNDTGYSCWWWWWCTYSDQVISGSTYLGWGGYNNSNGTIDVQTTPTPNQGGSGCGGNHGTWDDVFSPTPCVTGDVTVDPLAGRVAAPTISGGYGTSYSDSSSSGCSGDNPWQGDGYSWYSNGPTFSPGNYESMTFNASCKVYTFNPGVYVIGPGGLNVTGSNDVFQGTGVTLYFVCGSSTPAACGSGGVGGGVSVTGNHTFFAWSAPTTGPQRNILYFFDPNDKASFNVGTSASPIDGFWSGTWGGSLFWNWNSWWDPWGGALYGANVAVNIDGTAVMLMASPIICATLNVDNTGDGNWWTWEYQGIWIGGYSTGNGSSGTSEGVENPGVGGYPALVG
jgi:hypothetical protein